MKITLFSYKHRSKALKVGGIGRFYFACRGNCGGTHSVSLFPYKPSTMNHSTPIFVSHTIIGLTVSTYYPLDMIRSDEQWWLCVRAVRKDEERDPPSPYHRPTPTKTHPPSKVLTDHLTFRQYSERIKLQRCCKSLLCPDACQDHLVTSICLSVHTLSNVSELNCHKSTFWTVGGDFFQILMFHCSFTLQDVL